MAEEKLTFKIGSELTGDGFNKADGAVRGIAQTANKAKGALNLAIGEFKAMDNELGKIAGSAGSVIQSFAQFGMIGGVVAAAQASIGVLTDKIEEMGEKCLGIVNQMNAINDRFRKLGDSSAIKRMNESLKDATTEAERAMKAIKDTSDAVNALAGAKGESAVAKANERIAALMKEKADAVAKALNEFQKQVEAAKGDLRIAQVELEEAHRRAADEVEKSKRDYASAQAKLMQAEDNLAAAKYAVAQAEGDYKKAKIHGAVSEQEYQRKLEAARNAERNATEAVQKAKTELAVADEKQEAAQSKMNAEISKAEAKVIALTATRDEAIKKLEKASAEEEKAGMSAAELAEWRKEETKRAKAERQAVEKAAAAKIQAIDDTIKELENEKTALQDMRKAVNKAEAAYNAHHSWMAQPWERDENGAITKFKDFEKFQRWNERAEADAQSRQLYNDRQQARADDIQRRLDNNRYVSESDRKFLNNWNKFKEQLKGEDSIDKQIQDWKEKQTTIAKQTKDVIDSIETNLKQALELE